MTPGVSPCTLAGVVHIANDVDTNARAASGSAPAALKPATVRPMNRRADVLALPTISFATLAVGLSLVLAGAFRWDTQPYPFWREAAVGGLASAGVGAIICRSRPPTASAGCSPSWACWQASSSPAVRTVPRGRSRPGRALR